MIFTDGGVGAGAILWMECSSYPHFFLFVEFGFRLLKVTYFFLKILLSILFVIFLLGCSFCSKVLWSKDCIDSFVHFNPGGLVWVRIQQRYPVHVLSVAIVMVMGNI